MLCRVPPSTTYWSIGFKQQKKTCSPHIYFFSNLIFLQNSQAKPLFTHPPLIPHVLFLCVFSPLKPSILSSTATSPPSSHHHHHRHPPLMTRDDCILHTAPEIDKHTSKARSFDGHRWTTIHDFSFLPVTQLRISVAWSVKFSHWVESE